MNTTMTNEQREQRQTLINMGYPAAMLDVNFRPDEYGMLIQESLLDDLIGDDEDDE